MFDFDGLILDTETPLFVSWMDIYRDAGLSVSPATWASVLGGDADPPAAYEMLERHLGHPIDRSALRARRLVREAELLARQTLLPGVCELLAEAGSRQLKLAVASSSERAWVEKHLARFDVLNCFDAIVCAGEVDRTKPFPDLYTRALERLSVHASEAIALEDSTHGVDAAKRAGLFCVAVPNAVTRYADFSRADLVLSSLFQCSLDELIRAAEGAGP